MDGGQLVEKLIFSKDVVKLQQRFNQVSNLHFSYNDWLTNEMTVLVKPFTMVATLVMIKVFNTIIKAVDQSIWKLILLTNSILTGQVIFYSVNKYVIIIIT